MNPLISTKIIIQTRKPRRLIFQLIIHTIGRNCLKNSRKREQNNIIIEINRPQMKFLSNLIYLLLWKPKPFLKILILLIMLT